MKPIAIIAATSIHSSLALISYQAVSQSSLCNGKLIELSASSFVTRTSPFQDENTGGNIDVALAELHPLDSFSRPDDNIMEEMHTLLSDGHGHLISDLARSIWEWENSQRIISQSSKDEIDDDEIKAGTSTVQEKLFPAAQLKFSTRRGLRMVDSIAHEVNHNCRYPDLIQDGVVALMDAMVEFDPRDGEVRFESYARGKIKNAMKKTLKGGGGWLVRDALGEPKSPSQSEKMSGRIDTVEPHEQIVAPFRKYAAEDNPTPEDIALIDMIQHDLREFLDRVLNEKELMVVRMKFDLDGSASAGEMDLITIANHLGIDHGEVRDIESRALEKLRKSFNNDYMGAYLDHDHTEEVSL